MAVFRESSGDINELISIEQCQAKNPPSVPPNRPGNCFTHFPSRRTGEGAPKRQLVCAPQFENARLFTAFAVEARGKTVRFLFSHGNCWLNSDKNACNACVLTGPQWGTRVMVSGWSNAGHHGQPPPTALFSRYRLRRVAARISAAVTNHKARRGSLSVKIRSYTSCSMGTRDRAFPPSRGLKAHPEGPRARCRG